MCFLFFCVMVTWDVIISQKLYRTTLARISWMMYSSFFEWRHESPTAYLSSLKDVSIPQRILYIFLISSAGNSSEGRFVIIACFNKINFQTHSNKPYIKDIHQLTQVAGCHKISYHQQNTLIQHNLLYFLFYWQQMTLYHR